MVNSKKVGIVANIQTKNTLKNPSVLNSPETDEKTKLAPMYWIVMHNDPVTTMDFVVDTLINVFGYDQGQAFETMYLIHTTALAKIAVLPLEHAETKVTGVHQSARINGFPLTCTIEPDSHGEGGGA